jgi:hypothetical protein
MLLGAAALIVGVVVLYRVNPDSTWWMPPCLFHRVTGLYCPGCGTGRALHRLLHGDLVGAWRLNPLMVLVIPLLVYLVARSRRGGSDPLPVWLPWTIVGVIAVYWVARNIPVYPFTLLAPH